MNILFITSNKNYLDKASQEWAKLTVMCKEASLLQVIVLTSNKENFKTEKINETTWIYPTSSSFRWLGYFDVFNVLRSEAMWQQKVVSDIVVADDPFIAGLAGAAISKRYNLRFIIHVRENYWDRHKKDTTLFDRMFLIPIDKMLDRAEKVCVYTRRLEEKLTNFKVGKYKSKVYRFPFFVDTQALRDQQAVSDIRKNYPGFGFTILSVAPLESESRLDVAIETLFKLREWNQQVGMVLVGRGSDEAKLKNRAKELGIDDWVGFESDQSDLVSYLRTSNAYVAWSETAEEDDETLMMASIIGAPMVAIDTPYARSLIQDGENGFLIKDKTPLGAFNEIIKLMKDSSLQTRFRLNSNLLINEKFTKSREEYLQMIQNLWK